MFPPIPIEEVFIKTEPNDIAQYINCEEKTTEDLETESEILNNLREPERNYIQRQSTTVPLEIEFIKTEITYDEYENTKREETIEDRKNCDKKPDGDKCGMQFLQKSQIEHQKRTHKTKILFTCDECDITFNRKSNLRKHLKIHTGELPFICQVCGMQFSRIDSLNRHERIYSVEKPFACDECGMKFLLKSNLKQHQRRHTGETPFVCGVCGVKFPRKDYLVRHEGTHSNECGVKLTQSAHLTSNKRIHTGERPFSCNLCDMKFQRKEYLTHHTRIHTNEKPFVCDVGAKPFRQKYHLVKHKRSHKDEKVDSDQRADTGEEIDNGKEIENNEPTGSGEQVDSVEKRYVCDECGKKFSRCWNLNRHQRARCWNLNRHQRDLTHKQRHSGENKCDMQLTVKENVVLPKRVRTVAKRFDCDECGINFSRKSVLEQHKQIHSGKRFYSGLKIENCEGVDFGAQVIRMHTGEKPFLCQECGRSFSLKPSLERHKLVHRGICMDVRVLSCDECGLTFARKTNLEKHFRGKCKEINRKYLTTTYLEVFKC